MEDRFDQIMQLSPRRFHVSDSPPFGYGIVFCGHTNGDDEDCITNQSSGIINCKPGIWRSATREVEQPETAQGLGCDMECYVYWVSDGSIDMTQSVQVWEAYEEKSRSEDESVDLDDILPEGVEWTRAGSYYDDGGVCTVLSTEYLTKAAARKIMTGSRTDNDEEEEVEYGYYLETITLNHMDGDTDNYGFTLGGLAFGQDSVGGPPYISVARQNGQAIAIKLHAGTGNEQWDEVDEDAERMNATGLAH